jgi:hypothetical protein
LSKNITQFNNENFKNIEIKNNNFIKKYSSDNNINRDYIQNYYDNDNDEDIIDKKSIRPNKVSYINPNKSNLLDERDLNEEKNNYDFNLEENENNLYNSNNNGINNDNILMEELQDVSIIQKDRNNMSSFNNIFSNNEKKHSMNISNFNLNQDEKEEGDRIEQAGNTENEYNNKKAKNTFDKFKNMKNISNFINRKSKNK